MKNLFMSCIVSLLFFSCASRQTKLLDVSWVSMKQAKAPTDKDKLVKTGYLEEKYCLPFLNSNAIGLMDEAVNQAHKNRQVDYIKFASFMLENETCVVVSGEGYRLEK